MKEVGFETVTILLVLLPGFLCARMVQRLCVRREQTDVDKLVEALLYSFLVYVIFANLRPSPLAVLSVQSTANETNYSIETHAGSLLLLAGVAIGLALLMAALETNDVLGRLLRRLRVTQRTARSSLWADVFHVFGGYIQVELQDERSVIGWLRLYSDEPNEPSLFLQDASWVDKENNVTPIDGPGIYLTRDSGIRSIMFLRANQKASPPATA